MIAMPIEAWKFTDGLHMQAPLVGCLSDPDHRQSGTVAFAYPAFRWARRVAGWVALAVAFALAWRPHWLRVLAPWVRAAN